MAGEIEIKILSSYPDRWVVESRLTEKEYTGNVLLTRIREIKKAVASEVNVPLSLLHYSDIISNTPTEDGYILTFNFVRENVKKGRPEVRIESVKSPSEVIIPNMKAVIDLYVVDPFDNPVTMDLLRNAINSFMFQIADVDYDALLETLDKVHATHEPIKEYVLAEGTLPEIGKPGEIEFSFHAEQVESKMNKLMGATKVFKDDLLCTVYPPTKGEKPGYDVFGREILPLEGSHAELDVGDGITQMLDLSFKSRLNGIVRFEKEWVQRNDNRGFERTILKVKMYVEPILVVNGSEVDSLSTDENVEIQGSLKEGAKIRTSGNIFIDGEISKGADINTSKDLAVTGEVRGGTINADGSVIAENNVIGSKVRTGNKVDIRGLAEESTINGKEVSIHEVRNCTIEAAGKVEINKISGLEEDRGENRTRIKVGVKDFIRDRIEIDKKHILSSKESLDRLVNLLGPELVEDIGEQTVQTILIRFCAQEKKRGNPPYSQEQLMALRKLIESIIPLMSFISEKNESIEDQRKKMKETPRDKEMVVIRESVAAPVDVEIRGCLVHLKKQKGPVSVGLKFQEDDVIAEIIEGVDLSVETTKEADGSVS